MSSNNDDPESEETAHPAPGDTGSPVFESENAKAFAAAADFIRQSVGPDAYGASWDSDAEKEQLQVVKLPAVGLAAEISESDLDRLPVAPQLEQCCLNTRESGPQILEPFPWRF